MSILWLKWVLTVMTFIVCASRHGHSVWIHIGITSKISIKNMYVFIIRLYHTLLHLKGKFFVIWLCLNYMSNMIICCKYLSRVKENCFRSFKWPTSLITVRPQNIHKILQIIDTNSLLQEINTAILYSVYAYFFIYVAKYSQNGRKVS